MESHASATCVQRRFCPEQEQQEYQGQKLLHTVAWSSHTSRQQLAAMAGCAWQAANRKHGLGVDASVRVRCEQGKGLPSSFVVGMQRATIVRGVHGVLHLRAQARQAAGARQLAQRVQGRQSELLSCAWFWRYHFSVCACSVQCVAVAEDGQARRAALLASVKRGEVRLLPRLSG